MLLAKGIGVPGTRVSSLDAFRKALLKGWESEGPTLIETALVEPGGSASLAGGGELDRLDEFVLGMSAVGAPG